MSKLFEMGWFEHRTTIFKTENKQEYSLAAFKPQIIPQSFEAALVAKNGYDLTCFNFLQLWYARKTKGGGYLLELLHLVNIHFWRE